MDDHVNDHNYLSKAQKEELRKRQTPKKSDTRESQQHLFRRYGSSGKDSNVMSAHESDDDVISDRMMTQGYIGEEVPELPNSNQSDKKPSGLEMQIALENNGNNNDDEMSEDIVEHMQTMGGDIDGGDDENDEYYDDAEEYYDPASPNAMEHKVTIGADPDDIDDFGGDYDNNNYGVMTGNNNYEQEEYFDAVGSPSDDIYAPAGPTMN